MRYVVARKGEYNISKKLTKLLKEELIKKTHKKSALYNFKSKIVGNFETNSQMDRCTTYFYYLRYFEANLESNQKILFGVATDYAEIYPDAPNYWIVNKNNEIEKIGTSNIDKYSLYFELSK